MFNPTRTPPHRPPAMTPRPSRDLFRPPPQLRPHHPLRPHRSWCRPSRRSEPRGGEAVPETDTDTSSSSKPDTAKSSAPAEVTREQRDAARKAAGLPAGPKAAERQAFLDALNAIDPRIIKPGKEDQAVSRGINQCGSIKSSPKDRDKLAQLALERFTVTTRLPEISTPETGGKILDSVHKHICADF